MGPVQDAPFHRIIVLDVPTAQPSVGLTMKTEYKSLCVGELAVKSVQPAPSQWNMVAPLVPVVLPTAHPSVGEIRKTLRSSFVESGLVNADQVPVGHIPDHLRIFVVPLPTAQPSMPPGNI
jgi:hypothetical protein